MRKAYKLDGDICANCAGKIQAGIEKIPGVNKASVNAMTMRFTLDADDAAYGEVLERSLKVFEDIEPDCEVLR